MFELLFEHHFFVLPTLGENFGHAIFESMLAGRPVLISDMTPWLNLRDQGCGWDIPLSKPEMWKQQIEACVSMEDQEYAKLSKSTHSYAKSWLEQSDLVASMLRIFESDQQTHE